MQGHAQRRGMQGLYPTIATTRDQRLSTGDERHAANSTAELALVTMQRYHHPAPSSRHENGFSLLEVLISVVILSFALLGAAGLQVTSLQATREARLQAAGVRYGQELAELMRSNKHTAVQLTAANNPYIYDSTSTTITSPGCGYPGTSACATAGTALTGFTSPATAQRDMYEWTERMKADLPGARILVCEDSAPFGSDGLPRWACTNTGGILVLKIGWTRQNTLRGATGTDATDTTGANTGAFDKALRPAVIFSLTPGSTT